MVRLVVRFGVFTQQDDRKALDTACYADANASAV
jgi:hypothetical protein